MLKSSYPSGGGEESLQRVGRGLLVREGGGQELSSLFLCKAMLEKTN